MFKVNNKAFFVNFEHISHFCSSVSIVKFEHVIAGWDAKKLFDFLSNLIPFSHNLLWWLGDEGRFYKYFQQ